MRGGGGGGWEVSTRPRARPVSRPPQPLGCRRGAVPEERRAPGVQEPGAGAAGRELQARSPGRRGCLRRRRRPVGRQLGPCVLLQCVGWRGRGAAVRRGRARRAPGRGGRCGAPGWRAADSLPGMGAPRAAAAGGASLRDGGAAGAPAGYGGDAAVTRAGILLSRSLLPIRRSGRMGNGTQTHADSEGTVGPRKFAPPPQGRDHGGGLRARLGARPRATLAALPHWGRSRHSPCVPTPPPAPL